MTDAWHWWSQAIETPKEIGKSLLMSPDHPEQGFYRTKRKNGAWEPVAIWKWVALRSGQPVKEKEIGELWNWCGRYPISSEEYDARLDGTWAGDDPVVASMIGHNAGDDLEMLRDQIEAARQGAEAYVHIESDEQAAKAQSLRARLNELAGEADKRREALKRPHLEAGKAIDQEWMPLVKDAKAVADMVRRFISDFETVKLRERRRIEEERQRVEQERLREEERVWEEARLAAEQGRQAVVPPAPPPLPPLPPIETTIKGSYGRAATVGTERVVTAITDQDALYKYLRGHEFLIACLLDLAKKAVRAGDNPPGVTIEEKARIS
jgi:hypothetical protein